MTMFWLKTQAGWRETSRLEHAGAVGTYDLSKVSDADLNRLEAILRRSAMHPAITYLAHRT
jgi:hypothetical protein